MPDSFEYNADFLSLPPAFGLVAPGVMNTAPNDAHKIEDDGSGVPQFTEGNGKAFLQLGVDDPATVQELAYIRNQQLYVLDPDLTPDDMGQNYAAPINVASLTEAGQFSAHALYNVKTWSIEVSSGARSISSTVNAGTIKREDADRADLSANSETARPRSGSRGRYGFRYTAVIGDVGPSTSSLSFDLFLSPQMFTYATPVANAALPQLELEFTYSSDNGEGSTTWIRANPYPYTLDYELLYGYDPDTFPAHAADDDATMLGMKFLTQAAGAGESYSIEITASELWAAGDW